MGTGAPAGGRSAAVAHYSLGEGAPELLVRDSHQPLHLVLRTGPTVRHISLPPYFPGGSAALETRLSHWWGQAMRRHHAPPPSAEPAGERSPAQIYDAACRGESPSGEYIVPEGTGWMTRGPFASLLLFVPILHALSQVDAATRETLMPWAGLALGLALAVPGVWFLRVRARARVRNGIAMVFTAQGLLIRGTSGVTLLGWEDIHGIEVDGQRLWSPFVGATMRGQLVLSSMKHGVVRFDASLLGVPVEVAASMARQIQREFRKLNAERSDVSIGVASQ